MQLEANSNHAADEPVQTAIQTIADKLGELATGANQLRELYGEYAEASDLTFIKILEERYALLYREILAIHDIVAQIHANGERSVAEVNGNGG